MLAQGNFVVSQQYYRYVNGVAPANYQAFDARLHIFADGTGKLVDEQGSRQQDCFWWEIVLPDHQYIFYFFYANSSDDFWNSGAAQGLRKFQGKIEDQVESMISWELVVPRWNPPTRMHPFLFSDPYNTTADLINSLENAKAYLPMHSSKLVAQHPPFLP